MIYESPTNWGSIFPDAPLTQGSTGFPGTVMHSVHCLILDRAIQVLALFLRLLLKLKLQNFGHLMSRADPWEKTLMLGKTEGRRRRG